MSFFQLGPFPFISLGLPQGLKERLAREVKPGVDGATLWKMGKRGEPFVCPSVVDCASVVSAMATWDAYHQAVGGEPLPMVWGSVFSGLLFAVHDVQSPPEGLHATLLGIGGTLGSSGALLRAWWLLEPIDPAQNLEPTA